MNNLALKYRPQSFDDVVAQAEVVEILKYQVESKQTKNSYLFVGASGCGKTTLARILAHELNGGHGEPYEIDAASNTGVDNVRKIIDQASFKSINSEYKVFIIDECHMLSQGAWNALLKLLEEPPAHAVFILCTTDPQKIIPTVLSRVQRFDFTRIPDELIFDRLMYIINKENEGVAPEQQIAVEKEALTEIVEQSYGGLRTAITLLDKCLDYSFDVTYDNVCVALGISSKEDLVALTEEVYKPDPRSVLEYIDAIYDGGLDLKIFIKQWLEVVLKLQKEVLLGTYNTKNNLLSIMDVLLNINNGIKYDNTPKTLIQCELLLFMETLK